MWIRSQDKTVLVKVFDFRVDCCIGLDGENYIQGNLDSNYDSYILGTYKSKERAIEVLDEIQRKIQLTNIIKSFGINSETAKFYINNLDKEEIKLLFYPYKMPEA